MVKMNGEKFQKLWRPYWASQRELAAAAGVSPKVVVSADGGRPMRLGTADDLLEVVATKNALTLIEIKQTVELTHVPDEEQPNSLPGRFVIPRVSHVAASDFREYPVDLMAKEGVPGQLYPYPAQDPMVLRVVGSSMVWDHPETIYEGDDVIFANSLEEDIPDNAIVVALLKPAGTRTVKRLHHLDQTHVELVPQNPAFQKQKVKRSELILRAVKVIVSYPYKRK